MSSTYGWIITKDHISEGGHNCEGTSGPRGISDEIHARLTEGEGERWRCYDDDGNLYYEGRTFSLHMDGVSGFEPLDDFCMPDAGCTSICYWNQSTQDWEIL